MGTHRRRFAGLTVAAVAVGLASVHVGASAPPAESSADEVEAVLDRSLKVSAIGFANELVVVWADRHGVFERHGLDVELVTTAGGSAALAAVLSGAVDIGFTNGLSAIQAYAQGLPVQVVAGAYENATPVDPERSRGVVVSADSDIEGPCDLVDKTVATNELNGIGQMFIAAWVRDAGCDPSEVLFLALPSAQLAGAVESGRVDAANLSGYAAQDLVGRGVGRWIGEPMSETMGRVEYAMYIAPTAFIEENPEAIESFRAALDEALAEVNDPANETEALELAAEFGRTTPELLLASQQEHLDTGVDVEIMSGMADLLVEEGLLDEPLDVSGLVYGS